MTPFHRIQQEVAALGDPLMEVAQLSVSFGGNRVVDHMDFGLGRGEILGIVGESGSGKTVSCRALTGLLPAKAQASGRLTFDGKTYDLSNPKALEALRGDKISMIFQDPMSALDPLMRIHRQFALRGLNKAAAATALAEVGFADPATILSRYPHQLSGGQCQRIMIACAMISEPRLLIADEPTTALDVTIQAGILSLLRERMRRTGMSILFITHDLGVVSEFCDRVLVMQQGQIKEIGRTADVLSAPRAAYTQSLIAAIPSAANRGQRLPTLKDLEAGRAVAALPAAPRIERKHTPVLSLRNISVDYMRPDRSRFRAVDDISLDLHANEILGIVGESGSGKSTLAKAAIGLVSPSAGEICINGQAMDWRRASRADRRQMQYIFQDPRGALDPSRHILSQVREPLDVHGIGKRTERHELASQALLRAGLEPAHHLRRPGNLSGGQRQRATIARALALSPQILICDESVSALDVSVQARILNTLLEIRASQNIAILFISHDLSVIRHLCDRVLVMQHGKVVETGPVEEVWGAPKQAYTRALLAALPQLPQVVRKEKVLAS